MKNFLEIKNKICELEKDIENLTNNLEQLYNIYNHNLKISIQLFQLLGMKAESIELGSYAHEKDKLN